MTFNALRTHTKYRLQASDTNTQQTQQRLTSKPSGFSNNLGLNHRESAPQRGEGLRADMRGNPRGSAKEQGPRGDQHRQTQVQIPPRSFLLPISRASSLVSGSGCPAVSGSQNAMMPATTDVAPISTIGSGFQNFAVSSI